VEVERAGYSAPGRRSLYPLDAELNLPSDPFSHGVRERVAREATKSSFEGTVDTLTRTTGARVAKRQVASGEAGGGCGAGFRRVLRDPGSSGHPGARAQRRVAGAEHRRQGNLHATGGAERGHPQGCREAGQGTRAAGEEPSTAQASRQTHGHRGDGVQHRAICSNTRGYRAQPARGDRWRGADQAPPATEQARVGQYRRACGQDHP
jgi:hypothetical protein